MTSAPTSGPPAWSTAAQNSAVRLMMMWPCPAKDLLTAVRTRTLVVADFVEPIQDGEKRGRCPPERRPRRGRARAFGAGESCWRRSACHFCGGSWVSVSQPLAGRSTGTGSPLTPVGGSWPSGRAASGCSGSRTARAVLPIPGDAGDDRLAAPTKPVGKAALSSPRPSKMVFRGGQEERAHQRRVGGAQPAHRHGAWFTAPAGSGIPHLTRSTRTRAADSRRRRSSALAMSRPPPMS